MYYNLVVDDDVWVYFFFLFNEFYEFVKEYVWRGKDCNFDWDINMYVRNCLLKRKKYGVVIFVGNSC